MNLFDTVSHSCNLFSHLEDSNTNTVWRGWDCGFRGDPDDRDYLYKCFHSREIPPKTEPYNPTQWSLMTGMGLKGSEYWIDCQYMKNPSRLPTIHECASLIDNNHVSFYSRQGYKRLKISNHRGCIEFLRYYDYECPTAIQYYLIDAYENYGCMIIDFERTDISFIWTIPDDCKGRTNLLIRPVCDFEVENTRIEPIKN